jgi:type VI secretion system protein ImpA
MAADLDLDALLAPISAGSPAGADPRQNFDPSSLYFRLRDARAEARAAERQADAAGEQASAAQWGPVLQLGTDLLSAEAKDLEVAAWCTEALLRLEGLRGFTGGCALMQGLVESFWDELHPMPDEDGMASRVAPVAGLNGEGGEGTLIQPLRKLVLFNRPDGGGLAVWQYQQSAEAAGIGDAVRREQRAAAGVVPFAQVEAEAVAAGAPVFANLRRNALDAASAWRNLSDALDARAGAEAPSTSRVRDLLEEIAGIAGRFAPHEPAPAVAPQSVATSAALDPGRAQPVSNGSTITSREDALRILNEVADFFRRTEPHSPLAYTLDDAVRRGRLTWPELLEEIVPDRDIRDAVLRSLGIRPVPLRE